MQTLISTSVADGRRMERSVAIAGHFPKMRKVREGSYFEKALRASVELERNFFAVRLPQVDERRAWHIARASKMIVKAGFRQEELMIRNGIGPTIPGIGELSVDEVVFARAYGVIAREMLGKYLETPATMVSYLSGQHDPPNPNAPYNSHLITITYGAEWKQRGRIVKDPLAVAAVLNGAVIKIAEGTTLVFNGYRMVEPDFRDRGLGHMLMNAGIEWALLAHGFESSYIFGEAAQTEIEVLRHSGRYPILGIDYRQPELAVDYSDTRSLVQARQNADFEKCEPLNAMLGTRDERKVLPFEEVRRIIEAVYSYYNLAGSALSDFLARTFAPVPKTANVWVLNEEKGAFVPRAQSNG